MCTAPTQCWAHGAAPMLTLKGLSRHPYLSPSHMPSVTHARVARTHCMYSACTVWALSLCCLCAALTLPVRCMLPVRRMHAAMRCLCATMRAACALPCTLPPYPTVGNMHVLEPVPRVPTACLCLAVPPRPRWGAPMAWPWPPFFPQDMLPPLKSNISRFQNFLRRHQNG